MARTVRNIIFLLFSVLLCVTLVSKSCNMFFKLISYLSAMSHHASIDFVLLLQSSRTSAMFWRRPGLSQLHVLKLVSFGYIVHTQSFLDIPVVPDHSVWLVKKLKLISKFSNIVKHIWENKSSKMFGILSDPQKKPALLLFCLNLALMAALGCYCSFGLWDSYLRHPVCLIIQSSSKQRPFLNTNTTQITLATVHKSMGIIDMSVFMIYTFSDSSFSF